MKQPYRLINLLPFFLVLFSCTNNSENNKLIIGNWDGAEWLVNGRQSGLNVRSTHFTFNDKGEYTYDYSGKKEKGTYKIENEILFTTPAGEQEIIVKIIKLTKAVWSLA